MDKIDEQEKIHKTFDGMKQIIETIPYNKRQLDDFKDLINELHNIQNKDLLNVSYNESGFDLIGLICKHNKKKLMKYVLNESHVLHHLSIKNKDKESKYIQDAFFNAMCLNEFEIIEMLYDHWTGELHWIGHKKEYNKFDIDNLKQIKNSLSTAFEQYENWILCKVFSKRTINQNLIFNIQCLVAFSEFQIDLYSKLNGLKDDLIPLEGETDVDVRLRETGAIRDMILNMLNCYDEHTAKIGRMVQKSEFEPQFRNPAGFFETPKNTSKILCKTYVYIFFEVYFRKLDYNICLLILDNLHSLKLRLVMPEDSYQKLEGKVYQFIYHVSSKWSLYIPRRKKMKTKFFPGIHNKISCKFSLQYNADIFERGLHIMYLEKRDFESALGIFKIELRDRNIKENIRMNKTQLPNNEVNSLMVLPELRDIYSLKRISQHMSQLYSIGKYTREYVVLLVERTLQVVGEFLKSTNETLHIQPSTGALVEVELSVEVVNDLKTLRDLLCHAKDGELLKRIELEISNDDIFMEIFKEMKFFKKKIDEVIIIYKPVVIRALILNGLKLINNRKLEMPDIVSNDFFNAIRRVRTKNQTKKTELYFELFSMEYPEDGPVDYSEKYSAELIILVEHSLQLESKLDIVTQNIRYNLAKKITVYREMINLSLQKIVTLKTKWQQIVQSLRQHFPSIMILDYPNEKDINRINTYSKKFDLQNGSFNCLVEENTFSNAEIHWKFIKSLLEFIILKAVGPENFDKYDIQELRSISYIDNDLEKTVGDYLRMIESNIDPVLNLNHQNHLFEFTGIKKLRSFLSMANFLTQDEKKYLNNTLQKLQNTANIKQSKKISDMIDIINKNKPITKTEYSNFIAIVNVDKKARQNLMNLVMGYKRDPLIPWCLSKRITFLKEITQTRSVHQLVTQYKLDKTFRVLLEVLVFDILAILSYTKNNEIIKKPSKLLSEINMRNILIHGSPLLEIVGNVLDANDLPTELVTRSLEFLKEERAINALCALIDLDFDFTQIGSNLLTSEQQSLVKEFKTSKRWEEYLTFIPKQPRQRENKNALTTVDENLLNAVNEKDSDLVKRRIEEGGNVNLVYCERSLIHHALLKRTVDVIKVLLKNGADVNFRSKFNMTALHYASMNGFVEVVEVLLQNGADYLAVDDKNRIPLYLAGERNHHKVCEMLEKAMNK